MKFPSLLATTALLIAAQFGVRAETVALKLGHAQATDSTRHQASLKFAEAVSKKTGGRVEIQVMPNAEAGDDAAMVKSMKAGTLDMSVNSQGVMSKEVPEYAAIGLPFLFSSSSAAWQVLDGPIGKELTEKSAAKGFVVLGYWENGIRQVTNNVRAIAKPDDMKGLKLRTPPDPMTVDIMAALGASAQQIKFTEVHGALSAGVVDGQENPLSTIAGAKLYEVQKFVSLTGHKYEMVPLVISAAAWQKVPEADRKAVQDAAREATAFQRKLTVEADEKALSTLKDKGMNVQKIDAQAFVKATSGVTDKWLASDVGPFVKKLIAAAKS